MNFIKMYLVFTVTFSRPGERSVLARQRFIGCSGKNDRSSTWRVSEALEGHLGQAMLLYKIKSSGSLSLRWQEALFWVRHRHTDRATDRPSPSCPLSLSRPFFPASFSHNARGASAGSLPSPALCSLSGGAAAARRPPRRKDDR